MIIVLSGVFGVGMLMLRMLSRVLLLRLLLLRVEGEGGGDGDESISFVIYLLIYLINNLLILKFLFYMIVVERS